MTLAGDGERTSIGIARAGASQLRSQHDQRWKCLDLPILAANAGLSAGGSKHPNP